MARPLPKWIMQKYAILWTRFNQNEFDHAQADLLLEQNTSVVISFLKKNGWMNIQLNPDDSRKRVYTLKSPEQAVSEMTGEMTSEMR
ncbi:MAG: hypothetical protein V1729_03310 [Candidatus Woesearchaeota archaeon]